MVVVNSLEREGFRGSGGALADIVGREALWSCTTCRACEEVCPAAIKHLDKLMAMRRNLALMTGEFPGPEVVYAMDQTEVNGNPLGLGFAERGAWAEGLGVTIMADDPQVDILYFVGCYASFDRRNAQVARAFVKLCARAGVKVGILGPEERCCGEPMRQLGNEYLYQKLAQENMAMIKRYGVKKIVTTCPHCYTTLAKNYFAPMAGPRVEHHSRFLARLLEKGRLGFAGAGFACTYHDPCYLGRYEGIYQEPRALLQEAGAELVEMKACRADSFCCGAGGGRILQEERAATSVGTLRTRMASETGAGVMAVNCPFCLNMLEDSVKREGLDATIKVRDMAEILSERLAP